MTIDRNKLEPNGWKKHYYDSDFDKTYYKKSTYYGYIFIVVLHDSMDDVKIDTNYFDQEVEPDFLREVLEEVEKLEPDEGGETR